MDFLKSQLSDRIKMTALVNLYSLLKLPLLAFVTPQFVEFTDQRSVVKIRLGYRTRNHLNVMYFGALAMGAELSIAGVAVGALQKGGDRIDFIFKNFDAQFLKRADGHVHFVCDQVSEIRELIEDARKTPERLEGTFEGYAVVEGGKEPVMKYKLTLSVKNRAPKV